jgi:hypothetical protein
MSIPAGNPAHGARVEKASHEEKTQQKYALYPDALTDR